MLEQQLDAIIEQSIAFYLYIVRIVDHDPCMRAIGNRVRLNGYISRIIIYVNAFNLYWGFGIYAFQRSYAIQNDIPDYFFPGRREPIADINPGAVIFNSAKILDEVIFCCCPVAPKINPNIPGAVYFIKLDHAVFAKSGYRLIAPGPAFPHAWHKP